MDLFVPGEAESYTIDDQLDLFSTDNMLGDFNFEKLDQDLDLDLPVVGIDDVNLSCVDVSNVDNTLFRSPISQEAEYRKMSESSELMTSKSPWNGSDSGMSESFSFAGSPESINPEDLMVTIQPNLLFFDNELEETSAQENKKMNTRKSNHVNSKATDLLSLCSEADEECCDIDIDSLLGETSQNYINVTDEECVRDLNKQGVVTVDVSDDKESNYRAHGMSKKSLLKPMDSFEDSSALSRSDIKIIKVLRQPGCNVDATTNDIMKALDEKSKKNAQQAKLNRQKKKTYINNLETDVEKLKQENEKLVSECKKMKSEKIALEDEVDYLKSILANSSALAGLLKNINNVKEVKLSATIMGRKRAVSDDDDYEYNIIEGRPEKRARMVRENLKKAGVCLHVSDGEACLEFCSRCSSLANKTHRR